LDEPPEKRSYSTPVLVAVITSPLLIAVVDLTTVLVKAYA
jgi:hypothetical protein